MEPGSRIRLASAAILIVVFGAGTLLGVAWDRSLSADTTEGVNAEAGEEKGGKERRRRTPMYEQVGPTPGQKVLIDSIVEHHRDAMQRLHEEFREAYNPRYRALIHDTRDAIKGVFTPEQAAAYDSLLAERDRSRRERESRKDGG